MMATARLDVGLYLNLFRVQVPTDPMLFLGADRGLYPDLRPLRNGLAQCGKRVWVYAEGDEVYGYGEDCDLLRSKGFSETNVTLPDRPRLTSRMILEGFIDRVKQERYTPLERKGRCEVFNWTEYQSTSDGNVRLYRGFDLRSLFLKNRETDELAFGLIVDVTYTLQDQSNKPLNAHDIRERFGSKTFSEVRQIQGDLLPTGRINTEVARQRLLDHILPFVRRFPDFRLHCDITVSLHHEPTRIILGGEGR
ncbi:MAG: hypothetical protein M1136_01295 [Chloroflexi bacterium]|nr:hypothetical protein [Chloroflexota bacterium]MCL5074274.1 hypothetical protein [Chloroflexota bacterium]